MDPSSESVCGNSSLLLASPSHHRRSESLMGWLTLFIYPPCRVMRIWLRIYQSNSTANCLALVWFSGWHRYFLQLLSQWVLPILLGESKDIIFKYRQHKNVAKRIVQKNKKCGGVEIIHSAQAAIPSRDAFKYQKHKLFIPSTSLN